MYLPFDKNIFMPFTIKALSAIAGLLLIVALLFIESLNAKNTISDEVLKSNKKHSLNVEYFIDEKNEQIFESISDSKNDINWNKLNDLNTNFGFQPNPIWLKGDLYNSQEERLKLFLVISAPMVDYFDFYLLDSNNDIKKIYTGNYRTFGSRAVDNRNFIFPVSIAANQTVQFYLRVQESGSLHLPIEIWSPIDYFEEYQYEQSKFTLYFGIFVTLILYNLFLWLTVRSIEYGYYVLYILSVLFIQASQTGLGSQFIWPNFPFIASIVVQVSVPFAVIFAALFSIKILKLTIHERLYKLNIFILLTATLSLLLTPLLSPHLHLKLIVFLGIIASSLFLLIGFLKWRTGDLAAKIFTVAWFSFLLGTIIFGTTRLGLFPVNTFNNEIMWVGSIVEGLLLSFSVGARINQTRNEKAELEHEAARQEAENNAKSNFIAMLSHEVRTPINGVLGLSDLLGESKLDEEQTEFVNLIRFSGESLLTLINDVLDYSKIEAGKMAVELIETDLKNLVTSSLNTFKPLAKKFDIELVLNVTANVPDTIKSDPIRLIQVINNFISNAIKFTKKGSVVLSISVTDPKQNLRFEVSDTGIGLSQEQQNNLFQSFQQADSSTTRIYGGTGLGLFICKQLVSLMGGEIGVFSKPDEGSQFWFEIPLQEVS